MKDEHLEEQLRLAKKHWKKNLFPEARKAIMENKKNKRNEHKNIK